MATLTVLNPVSEKKVEKFGRAERLAGLTGKKTIGLVWNSKTGGNILLEYGSELLRSRFAGLEFKLYMGDAGSMMRHLTPEQVERIARECDAAIGATAD